MYAVADNLERLASVFSIPHASYLNHTKLVQREAKSCNSNRQKENGEILRRETKSREELLVMHFQFHNVSSFDRSAALVVASELSDWKAGWKDYIASTDAVAPWLW